MKQKLESALHARIAWRQQVHAASDVKRILKEVVVNQDVAANLPLPAERNLSVLFKVSRNTARKALRELVDENIIYRIHGKGTFVSGMAPSRRSGKKITIGVIFPELALDEDISEKNAPMHYNKLSAIETAASERGYVLTSLGRKNDIKDLLKYLPDLPVDGILMLAGRGDRQLAEDIRHSGKPMVLIAPAGISDDINLVAFDQVKTGYRVVKYLVQTGRRRICFDDLTLDRGLQMRLAGYQQAMFECGLPAIHGVLPHEFTPKIIRNIRRRMDAVIMSNDKRAALLIRALMRAGARVPDDLAVFGYFNQAICREIQPPLSSVNLPIEKQGKMAVEMLGNLIAGRRRPATQVLVETELVLRVSA